MNKFTTLLMGISIVTMIGCGGGTTSSNGADNSIDYTGTYDITAKSTTSSDNYGGVCLDAYGQMTIETSRKISGSVVAEWGYTLTLSGNVSSTGSISGGFARGSANVASFNGQMYENKGNGTWSDKRGCSGTWTVTR